MRERRHATRKYYHRNVEGAWFSLMGISFVVGAALGATLCLAYIEMTGGL